MSKPMIAAIAAVALSFAFAAEARATQICGWMVEKIEGDDLHSVDIYLQADGEMEFLYKVGGRGLLSEGSRSHSPSSGTYVLHAGQAERVWGFGATLSPPGKIDITMAIHQKPADIFDEKPTPVLAEFAFRRDVPESEKQPPATLAKKQCVAVK
jgi:hypothetical protein